MTTTKHGDGKRTFYHRTFKAKEILAQGFRDREALYGTVGSGTFRGVWLSDRPLGAIDNVHGDTTLKIELPEHLIAEYEWIEEHKHYREWLVPSKIVNAFGPPAVCTDEDAEDEWVDANLDSTRSTPHDEVSRPETFINKKRLREASSYLEPGKWQVGDEDGRTFNL